MICPYFEEPLYFFYVPELSALLYYSHIPAIVVALLIGIAVLLNDPKSLLNRLLFAICVSFSVWTFCTLIAWTNIHSDILLFAWSFLGPAAGLISIFSIYFTYVFLTKRDVGPIVKSIFLLLLAPILLLSSSEYTLGGFNLVNCDAFGFEGLTNTIYFPALGALAMVWILVLLIIQYPRTQRGERKQLVLLGTGIELFLFSFFTTVFLGQYLATIGFLQDSQIETYGYFGMTVFAVYIGILIVRFKAFHVSLIASQALVIALLLLIGAEFTFVSTTTQRILVGITFVLTAVIGIVLIRSVKEEIRQRQLIEKQEKELEEVNRRQETLLHFVSHEIKGYLTKNMSAFASLSEGDLGAIPASVQDLATRALAETRNGARAVMDILQASNQKKGTMRYTMAPFDLKEAVESEVNKVKPHATEKGLAMTFEAEGDGWTIQGDKNQLTDHVIRNLLENAVNYTLKGSVVVSLSKAESKVIVTVADTGVGISEEDKKNLFTEGGKGKDSTKVNIHSTGYGLFIAKAIVEAHKGTIRAESEGADKGSRFIVELPA